MATINQLVGRAYRRLNVIATNEDPTPAQVQEGINIVNSMLDHWNTNFNKNFYVQQEDFSLVGGQQEYTIGSGGDFNTTRPMEIKHTVVTENGTTWPSYPITYDEWMDIYNKGNSSNYPTWFYYDKNFPLGKLYLFRKPANAATITIASHKQLGSYVIDDTVSLPPGYEQAIIDNLAYRLLPTYPSEAVGGMIAIDAKNSLRNLKRINAKNAIKEMHNDLDTRDERGQYFDHRS